MQIYRTAFILIVPHAVLSVHCDHYMHTYTHMSDTFFTLYYPYDQFLHRVSKFGVGGQALLETLVMVLLRTFPDVSNGW